MKNISIQTFCIGMLLFCFAKTGQAQEISFDYDAAGNQIKREWICFGCLPFQPTSVTANKTDQIAATKPDFFNPDQKVIAYPNPLTETLNIKWEPLRKYITAIEVYSMTGVNFFKKSYKYEEAEFHEAIQFTKMTAGMYVVKVTFSDGKQELIKVVKQ
jgi:hypothetical protein